MEDEASEERRIVPESDADILADKMEVADTPGEYT